MTKHGGILRLDKADQVIRLELDDLLGLAICMIKRVSGQDM